LEIANLWIPFEDGGTGTITYGIGVGDTTTVTWTLIAK
jgi:hypothetical protein